MSGLAKMACGQTDWLKIKMNSVECTQYEGLQRFELTRPCDAYPVAAPPAAASPPRPPPPSAAAEWPENPARPGRAETEAAGMAQPFAVKDR